MAAQKRIEKLTLNNQIVLMRKDVKRARVWLINNLNHKIKKIKGSKGVEETNDKNLKKIERFREEIQILKDIELDEVSKFAICHRQGLHPESAGEKKLEMTQLVMLKLANHKLVQDQVVKFRQNYSVPADRLVLLVRSLGLQYQKKKKKMVESFSSETNSSIPKVNTKSSDRNGEKAEILKSNLNITKLEHMMESRVEERIEENIKQNSKENVEENGEEKTEHIQKNSSNIKPSRNQDSSILNVPKKKRKIVKECEDQPSKTPLKLIEDSIEVVSQAPSEEPPKEKRKTVSGVSRSNPSWPSMSGQKIDKQTGTIEIKQLKLDEYVAETIDIPTSEIPKQNQERDFYENPRDSFFLGGVDIVSDEEESHTKKNQKPSKLPSTKRAVKNQPVASESFKNRKLLKGKSSSFNKKAEPELVPSEPEVLHPSWQAKRKEKQLILSSNCVQGKKIVFNDD